MRIMEALSGSKALILSLLISIRLLWKSITSLRYRSALQRHGCRSVASYPHKGPFLGYDLYRINERSRQQNKAVVTLQWLFDSYGTERPFKRLLGVLRRWIIRAVLKERPYSFGVEPFRKPFNNPWDCRGIQVSDGQEWKMSRAMLRPLFQKS